MRARYASAVLPAMRPEWVAKADERPDEALMLYLMLRVLSKKLDDSKKVLKNYQFSKGLCQILLCRKGVESKDGMGFVRCQRCSVERMDLTDAMAAPLINDGYGEAVEPFSVGNAHLPISVNAVGDKPSFKKTTIYP